ncbi:MAG: hypothetical protein A2Z04_06735 [Chloroflexi bacterium RBG_16_57_9]|nr:MAG: hypothetical protein A2Z04_06735 [Chloroflexi bacterium RBG_16_57_9]
MEKIVLRIGTIVGMSSGHTQDTTREVEFMGEVLSHYTAYDDSNRSGGPTDTRGVSQTLYRAEDGRLIVYVEDWSHWQGEPSHYYLLAVDKDDLGVNGRFEELGRGAGFGRALTLDEALADLGLPVEVEAYARI